MASRTTSANINGYWGDDTLLTTGSFADLAYGDTLILGSGAILKINPTEQTPTGITVGVNILCIAGFAEIWWENDSTTTPLIYYGPVLGSLRVESGCKWVVRGNTDLNIGTGDGTANQVLTGYTSAGFNPLDEPAVIFVGASKVPYINIAHTTGLTTIGVGVLGNFFHYNTTTGAITGGDDGKPTNLSSNAAAGQAVINVVSAAAYTANDWIHLINAADDTIRESLEILSIATNAITFKTNLRYSYTTANGSFIRLTKGGNSFPNGAAITVINVCAGSKESNGTRVVRSTLGDNFKLNTNPGGNIDIENLMCFGFYFAIDSCSSLKIDGLAVSTAMVLTNLVKKNIERLYVCPYRQASPEPKAVDSASNTSNITFKNSVATRKTSTTPVVLNVGFVLENTSVFILEKDSGGTKPLGFLRTGIILRDSVFAGGHGNVIVGVANVKNVGFSESITGSPSSYYSSYLCDLAGFSESVVDNIYVLPDGSAGNMYYGSIFVLQGVILNINTAYNVDMPLIDISSGIPCILKRITAMPPVAASSEAVISQSTSCPSATMTNISIVPNNKSGFGSIPSNCIYKAISSTTRNVKTVLGVATNTHFYDMVLPDNSGFIGLFMTPKTVDNFDFTSSDPEDVAFDNNGSLYIITNNGWIEFEWPHWIIGVTGYPSNGTINISGANTSNFKIESSVNLGSGWSDRETLYDEGTYYPTVLSSKTIVNARHKLKIRISKVTGNVTDYINRLNFQTNVDYETYLYPLSEATLTLSGIVEGTEVRIFDSSDNELAGTDSVGATGIFEYAYGYDADVVVRVEVISVAYKNKSFNVTLREYDQAVVVQQEPDNTYINPA